MQDIGTCCCKECEWQCVTSCRYCSHAQKCWHEHKPTFLETTLTNQNCMHETIKSRLNADCVCVCVGGCVCVCARACVRAWEHLLWIICPHCIITILMKDICKMNKYLNLQLASYMRYIRLREYLWFWLLFLIFQDFFYNDDIEISYIVYFLFMSKL
jgi:hypothetical protein